MAEIKRNYQSNILATDREWFYKDSSGVTHTPPEPGGIYPVVEYDASRSFQAPAVVFKKGINGVLRVTFRNDTPSTVVSGSFSLGGVTAWSDYLSLNEDIATSASNTTFSNLAYGDTHEVVITLGNIPEYVTMGELYLSYTLTLDCDNPAHTVSEIHQTNSKQIEDLFVVYDDPVGFQSVPWTDLLRYSCTYASEETGMYDVAEEVTKGIHFGFPWHFDSFTPAVWHDRSDTSYYSLSEALMPGPSATMDCFDIAGLLYLALAGQGIETTLQMLSDDNAWVRFATNPICPMGSNPVSGVNYGAEAYEKHCVVKLNSGVYDAAAAQLWTPGGGVFKLPPFGWVESSYWQTSNGAGGFFGLVDKYEGNALPTAVGLDSISCDLPLLIR